MLGVIHNLASLPRDKCTRASFSKKVVDGLGINEEASFRCTDGRRFRAVKGRTIDNAVSFRVFTVMNGNERLEGVLEATEIAGAPFAIHPWVADEPAELVPSIVVRRDGKDYESGKLEVLRVVDHSKAHIRYHLRSQIEPLGFVFEWWCDINSLDPVLDCWGKLTWSTRLDPNESVRIDGIFLKTGELYIDHFAKAKGIGQPFPAGDDWIMPVSGPRNFADGTAIDFSGQMMAFISDPGMLPTDLDLEQDTGWISQSIRSLQAAMTGWPVVGAGYDGWSGSLLAAKNTPRVRDGQIIADDLQREWGHFTSKMENGGDFYDTRRFGVGRNPGGTGDKEDFAAVKGSYIVSARCEPKALHMMAYSAYAEMYRPGAALFENGEPLDPMNHPDWWVWSNYTHYHPGVSRDRLGKTASSFGFPHLNATTYDGHDDQHISMNSFCYYLLMTDDPLAESVVRMRSITTQKMLNNRVGATRAVGRLFGAWSQYVLLLDQGLERDRYMDRISEKLRTVTRDSDIKSQGPIKIIAHGSPDLRKQVFYPPGHPEAGQLAKFWSVWEHGLFAVGCYNLWKAIDDPRAWNLLHTICYTVVTEALFQQNGDWYLPDDMVWLDDGVALDPSLMTLNSKQLVVTPGIGGTTGWAFCTLLIATEILTGEAANRAREAVKFFTGGMEANSRRQAEWWACVASVSG